LTRPSWTEAEMHGNPQYRRRWRMEMSRNSSENCSGR
jgi:hypothetical protein